MFIITDIADGDGTGNFEAEGNVWITILELLDKIRELENV